METLHKDNALSLEHMRQAIHNAGGRFYQYRPCRRDASTVYDIENIRHDVVYAQTPLNMNDPFDSMIGFSTEKIYSECIAMTLDALDLTSTNRVILSILLKYRAFGKMAQLISCIKDIQTYLKSRQKATHQTMIPLDAYVCRDMHSLYSKAPKNLKAVFNGEEFSVLAWLSAKLSPMNISEKAITEMLHIEGLLDQLQQQVEEMRDSKYGPLLRAFLSKITVSCFSASGWNNPLMWSHYANSYTGICVEYDFEKIEDFIGFAHPVSYTTVRPTLSMADLGIAAVDLKSKDRLVKEDVDVERIISYLCCKNKCWQYEDEWRIINIGEENTPQFIKLPCVKSITFGPNVDSLCKRLLLEVCKSKGISCYDLRLNHENYGVERIPITNNAEYDINEEAEYISLLSAQLTKWMQIMQTNSEKIVIEINSHTFDQQTFCLVLQETEDILGNMYFLKGSLNRLAEQSKAEMEKFSIKETISSSIAGMEQFRTTTAKQSEELQKSIVRLHINGILGNDNYRRAINHLKNIQELSEKIDGIPWNALFTEKVTDKTTVE